MDEEDEVQVDFLGQFIRDEADPLPDGLRHRWALAAGRELVEGSDLPRAKVRVLLAANLLRQLGANAAYWARAQRAVEAAARTTVEDWPIEGYSTPRPYYRDDPSEDREAFEQVSERLKKLEEAARTAERTINEAGFRFKWDGGVLKDGKRGALRVMVQTLLADRDDLPDLSPDSNSLQKELARELAPFFPDTRLDADDSHGVLKNTIRNALEELRGSSGTN